MKAREYLEQIEMFDKLIENKIKESAQWQDMALCITGSSESDKVQSTPNPQKMADAINKYIDYDAEIKTLVEKKQGIIRDIEQLKPIEYDVLHIYYVQYLTLYDVASKYNKSHSWAKKKYRYAMRNLQAILDERDEARKELLADFQ